MTIVTRIVPILFLGIMTVHAQNISGKIIRPTPGESLTITQGMTFVIGTLSPPQAQLTVNGAKADVSDDGAFIAMAPIRLLPKAKTIELGRNRRKRVDAAFLFVATHGTNTWTREILTSTPAISARVEPPIRVFSKPQPYLVTEDQIVSQTATTNWGLLYLPKGAFVTADARRGDRLRLTIGNQQETWVGEQTLERAKAWPEIGVLRPIRRGSSEVAIDVGAMLPFGITQKLTPPGLDVIVYNDGKSAGEWNVPLTGSWGFSARYESNTIVIAQKPVPDLSSGLRGKVICLDPGHNPDTGAVGPRGFTEREANLKIAEALEKMLVAAGARVVFTHRNEPLPLAQRRRAALSFHPDIFVSLHNNSVPDGTDPRTNFGTSAYYYHPQSKPLAEAVQSSMLAELGWPDQKVNQKSLAVCRISEFPSILVEPAFIILPDQEKLLMSEAGQRKIAKAVFDGIQAFFEPSRKQRA